MFQSHHGDQLLACSLLHLVPSSEPRERTSLCQVKETVAHSGIHATKEELKTVKTRKIINFLSKRRIKQPAKKSCSNACGYQTLLSGSWTLSSEGALRILDKSHTTAEKVAILFHLSRPADTSRSVFTQLIAIFTSRPRIRR